MLKRLLVCWVFICCLLIACSVSFASEKDVIFFEVPSVLIKLISVNHAQGSISFALNNIVYFYYVGGEDLGERILAASSLLADIRTASTVQVKSEPYGLHRKITNLLLFYGDRVIPDDLKEIPSKEKVSEKQQ